MFRALTDLLDRIFRPVNAFFSGGTGSAPPIQGGNVISPVESSGVDRLVDRLPVFVEIGAPTPLEPLRVPPTEISIPTGPAPIPLADNEGQKRSWGDVWEV